jgi:uncharacterized protein YbcI
MGLWDQRQYPVHPVHTGGSDQTAEQDPRSEQDPVPEQDPAVDVSQRISAEIAAIHRESYGEAVEAIETHILENAVVCVLDITLLPPERTLLEHGRGEDSIRQVRKEFQESIGPTFSAAVEHMTGRRVVAFVSETHIDPPFSIEFFRLTPRE